MSFPAASIIIDNFNYEKYVEQAVDSALAQDFSPLEIIVVDDGSTDGSMNVLKQYGTRIKLIEKTNGGQASAFNAGIAAAIGDVIFFLDADDFFDPKKVGEIVSRFNVIGYDKPAMVHHRLRVVDDIGRGDEGKLLGKLHDDGINLAGYAAKYRYLRFLAPPTSGLSINKKMASMLFPIPERGVKTSADDFIVRGASILGRLYSIEPVLASYRVHGKNGWYLGNRQQPSAFHDVLDAFLNEKLSSLDLEQRISYFDSMHCWEDLFQSKKFIELAQRIAKTCVVQHDLHTIDFTARFLSAKALGFIKIPMPSRTSGRNR